MFKMYKENEWADLSIEALDPATFDWLSMPDAKANHRTIEIVSQLHMFLGIACYCLLQTSYYYES